MLTNFNGSTGVHISKAQQMNIIFSKLCNLEKNKELMLDPYTRDIIESIRNYLDIKNHNSLWSRLTTAPVDPKRTNAIYQIIEVLENNKTNGDFYSAIACKQIYNSSFYNQEDINSSKLAEILAEPVGRYFENKARKKIEEYRQTGLTLMVTALFAMLFIPENMPGYKTLFGGFMLGLLILTSSFAMVCSPEAARIDKVFADNLHLRMLVDNVSNFAHGSVQLINNSAGRLTGKPYEKPRLNLNQ